MNFLKMGLWLLWMLKGCLTVDILVRMYENETYETSSVGLMN